MSDRSSMSNRPSTSIEDTARSVHQIVTIKEEGKKTQKAIGKLTEHQKQLAEESSAQARALADAQNRLAEAEERKLRLEEERQHREELKQRVKATLFNVRKSLEKLGQVAAQDPLSDYLQLKATAKQLQSLPVESVCDYDDLELHTNLKDQVDARLTAVEARAPESIAAFNEALSLCGPMWADALAVDSFWDVCNIAPLREKLERLKVLHEEEKQKVRKKRTSAIVLKVVMWSLIVWVAIGGLSCLAGVLGVFGLTDITHEETTFWVVASPLLLFGALRLKKKAATRRSELQDARNSLATIEARLSKQAPEMGKRIEQLRAKSCRAYVHALGLPMSGSSATSDDVRQAKKGFVNALQRMQELLVAHPEITSKHLGFTDAVRGADLQQAKDLVKHLVRAIVSCSSCKARFLVSAEASGETAPCPKCKNPILVPEKLYAQGADAARRMADEAV